MKIKKICAAIIGVVVFFLIAVVCLQISNEPIEIQYSIKYSNEDYVQVYYANDLNQFSEENSTGRLFLAKDEELQISEIVREEHLYRIDFGDLKNSVIIDKPRLKSSIFTVPLEGSDLTSGEYINSIYFDENYISIETEGIDSQFIFDLTYKTNMLNQKMADFSKVLDVARIVVALGGGVLFYLLYDKLKVLILWFIEIFKSTSVIMGLAFNDFKMRYATSYLGTIWAFVQPVVTVAIYVLVFGYGFKSAPVSEVPFALWLTAGIVPWFFFQDSWVGATNSLFEYSYLVKKVVFKISVLPVVKIISAMFVHAFFVVLTIALYIVFGQPIKITIIQTLYYTVCTLVLALGLSYITAACVVFFKDISQVVIIVLQFGMWLTPIMWSPDMFGPNIAKIIMFNPMYYIVQGYRDSFYSGVWFWEHPRLTIYFWSVSILIMIVGIRIYRRLEKHFADVL